VADRAAGAGLRIGSAHNAGDQIAFGEGARRVLEHAAERLVAEHQVSPVGRRLAVLAADDLAVGSTDPDRDGLHEDLAVGRVGLRQVAHDPRGAGQAGVHDQSSHERLRVCAVHPELRVDAVCPGIEPGIGAGPAL